MAIQRTRPTLLIFHDSLLPKLRGFNPTVTALIAGEIEIGVTAFSPIGGDAPVADFGPILVRRRLSDSVSCNDPDGIRTAWSWRIAGWPIALSMPHSGAAVILETGCKEGDVFDLAQ